MGLSSLDFARDKRSFVGAFTLPVRVERSRNTFFIPVPKPPLPPRPSLQLPPRNLFREVHPLQPRPRRSRLPKLGQIELTRGRMREGHRRRPLAAHEMGQRARIDAADADPPGRRHPAREILGRAEVGRHRHRLAHETAQRMRLARFDIFLIGPDIADVGKGERHHLPRVAGVGHDLLITGHRGVEAQFADRRPFGAKAPAPHGAPVGENDHAGCAVGARGRGSWIGQNGSLLEQEKPAMSLRECG